MNNPDEFVSLFNNIISLFNSFMTTSVPLTIAYVWLLVLFVKNKSLRTLFFWEKLIGKGMIFSDNCLQQAWINQKELQQFSVALPAIKYKNIYHARNMQEWKEQNKIGDSELSGLDAFFIYNNDYSSIKLAKAKEPSIFAAYMALACVAYLSLIALTVSLKCVISDATIGELKVNNEMVWVYKDKVERFSLLGKSWSVTLKEVNDGGELTADDIKSIRKSISSGDVRDFLEKNKVDTVISASIIFVVLFYFSILLVRFTIRSKRVLKLCDRVDFIKEKASKCSTNIGGEVHENLECNAINGESNSN